MLQWKGEQAGRAGGSGNGTGRGLPVRRFGTEGILPASGDRGHDARLLLEARQRAVTHAAAAVAVAGDG
jgi:hypothetical protein